MSIGPRFTPAELRTHLGLRYAFSDEQLHVISAPADEPLLVVAGAGSGKTELMALRVMWLIVNRYVRPDQVLGLTFTRKAAGELSQRIRGYLGRATRLLGHDAALQGEPTVSTYHSFAARIVREHGLRSGYEPSVRLLTEAACWQLADAVVRHHDSPAMRACPLGQASATAAVLSLAGELAEHLRDADDIEHLTVDLTTRLESLPGRILKPVQDMLDRQRGRLALLPLVRAYAHRKASLEAMDFGDQLSRAAVAARDHPEVADAERDRFRVVLLDEYQDTSQAQVVLLQSLFGSGHPVTAVGDPCQSIYGWRGASAGTLERFRQDFPTVGGHLAPTASLSVSFRNAAQILAVANELSAPLRANALPVKPLRAPRSSGQRFATTVRCAFSVTYFDEASWVADRIDQAWREWSGSGTGAPRPPTPPTTAVLVRARRQIPPLEQALRAKGLPVEVVGLGGLLDNPEVRDVVAMLQVLCDPTAGAAILRLLTGARWRIGPRDVVALYRRARQIALLRRSGDEPGPAAVIESDLAPERLDDATLAEALDDLGSSAAYSAEGLRRLELFRDELRGLRYRLGQSLPDLVADVAATIGLDVEVAVRGCGSAGLARAHLDAIGDVAARFAEETEGGTLSAFLAYLAAAEEEERGLPPGEVEVVDGAVQILTVHAAKGLEWDVVAVAGLCDDAFPAKSKSSDHWLAGMGVLPFPLRGDAAGLPRLAVETAMDARGMRDAVADFDQAWCEHQEREERRLAYVAATRPRHLLLCSGFQWGERLTKPRGPSVFLDEVAIACRSGAGVVEQWAAPPLEGDTNPTLDDEVFAMWPFDPLGERRGAVAEAAQWVRAAMADRSPDAVRSPGGVRSPSGARSPSGTDDDPQMADGDPQVARWAREVRLLLDERQRQRVSDMIDVVLPEHMSVSQLVTLRRDPQALARRLRRPMPEAPDVYARRGTAFHLWLEQRFGAVELFDLEDLPGSGDSGAADDEELEELQKAFLESDWAQRVPERVEVPFATVVGGVVVRGRMDAIFSVPGRPGCYDVIDWKTGRRPTGVDATAAAVQLAAYRLAWAQLAGVSVDQVIAGFHYVRENVTVRPADLLDERGLTDLVATVPSMEG
jgi:DNA helicase II / ATP-dependent DNA helicase PcrA